MTGPGLAGTAVIDLGDGWATEPAEPVERPAGRRHWTVSAAAAACLALLALTMIADKPPPPARLTELARWFEPQAFLLATAGTDTLLVQTHDAITAYDAADGRRRWSLPRVADSIHAAGDLIVLGFSTPEGESTEPQSTSHEAVAVDRMTGQVRWRAPPRCNRSATCCSPSPAIRPARRSRCVTWRPTRRAGGCRRGRSPWTAGARGCGS
ncbi:PQQ-binding-like beta-propeller repeat protein [Catellatospora coxensis]